MADRTRRVAIDNGNSGNDWYESGSFTSFSSDGFVTFQLPFSINIGINYGEITEVTLWDNGILSLGPATAAQIAFFKSGASPIPTATNAGFPGEFIVFDYSEGLHNSSYSYGIGQADYTSPFDNNDGVSAAFFSYNGGYQVILDQNGFSIVSEGGFPSSSNGYFIGNESSFGSGGISFDTYPFFLSFFGTTTPSTLTGTSFSDYFQSYGAADTIDGRSGADRGAADFDQVDYINSAAGVSVNLTTGVASGGDAQGDHLIDIESIGGSQFNDTITGSDVANYLYGQNGNDTLDGRGGNDFIYGGSGADNLKGGGGDDYVQGGPGADVLDGGTGTDILDYLQSTAGVTVSLTAQTASGGDAAGDTIANFESVFGSANGDDYLVGSAADNNLSAYGGNNTLVGLAGNDYLYAYGGVNFFDGGPGADQIISDFGASTLSYAGSSAGVTVNLETQFATGGDATGDYIYGITNVIGSEFEDSITGTAYNNRLAGGAGDDSLGGGFGDDILDGGTGADTLSGNQGDDSYFVDNPGDLVIESADQGIDTVLTTVSYALRANVERGVIYNSVGTVSLTGNILANELTGDGNSNILDGRGGADLMVGNGGDDFYVVDNPGDQAVESPGGGYDTVFASANFTLDHDLERVVAFDLRSTNAINFTGNELANELVGNDGANILNGKTGADVMTGNAGDDTYFVDNAGDLVNELTGGGYDTVFTSVNYTLRANVERGVISGAAGTISLYGNELANELSGDGASNILNGGAGSDIMTGYGGDDYYVVDNPGDQIIELAAGGYDTVFASASFVLGHDLERAVAFDLRSTNAMNFTGNELVNELVGNDGANVIDGGAGADVMTGNGGNDVYFVDNAGDLVNESAGGGYDTVFTSINYLLGSSTGGQIERLAVANRAAAQGLSLRGNALDNEISGDDGNNIIDGGAGHDILTGYAGSDSFVFASALGTANADHIADFDPATDRIALDHTIFTGLANGHLSASALAIGTAARDADDRIIYDPATGTLYFDPDGTGAMQAQVFATVHDGLALTADNFVVI